MVTNLCYADDIILFANLEAELQELVDHLDRVSCEYSLLINVDKTKVMGSDGIACHILFQNEQLEQMDMFPYLGFLIPEDRECMREFHTRLNRGQVIRASLQKIQKSDSVSISTNIQLTEVLVWPTAMYRCESWTLKKNIDAFEMKGLKKILRVSWTAKKTNEWGLNKAGVKSELLDTVKAKKLAYYGHTMRKQGSCLEKEVMQGTLPGTRRRGRPRPGWTT